MATTTQAEWVAWLPAIHADGEANGHTTPIVYAATTWEDSVSRMESMADLGEDYDGQGAMPPPAEVVAAAVRLAATLRSAGVAPPSWVFPGVNATLGIEWQWGDGFRAEIEVTTADRAEGYLTRPESPPAFWDMAIGEG